MNVGKSDLERMYREAKLHGIALPDERLHINMENAQEIFTDVYKFYLEKEGKVFVSLREFEEVVRWMQDNGKRGLFMHGDCGRGKSYIARYIIPSIILRHYGKVVKLYDAQEMNRMLDEILMKKLVCLDDIGTEEILVNYGNKRMALAEILDVAEKKGNFIIITTNLSKEQIIDKYGERVYDRLIALTKRIEFKGNSLRL